MLKYRKPGTSLNIILKDYNSVRDFNPSPYFRRMSYSTLHVTKEISNLIWKNIFTLFLILTLTLTLFALYKGIFHIKLLISSVPGIAILSLISWYLKIGDLEYYKIILRYIFKKTQLKYNRVE